jgi:hypothetical protein
MVGAVVQRENASFARMRSGVQSPSAPPHIGQIQEIAELERLLYTLK